MILTGAPWPLSCRSPRPSGDVPVLKSGATGVDDHAVFAAGWRPQRDALDPS